MLGLWLEERRLRLRDDLPEPEPPPGEAVIRPLLAGVCSTDLELVRGYYPYCGVPGHEFVGEVVAAPDAPEWVGRRVVGEINAACGTCAPCRRGHPTHCEQRTVLGIVNRHGVFAERFTLPLANLHPVPDTVCDEMAVFTEPLAAALEIQQQTTIHPTDRVLVVGAGRLGQLIAWTLALTGCDLQVVVRRETARALLAERHIATLPPDAVPARQFDVVVEATGNPQGFALARQAVRPRGTLVLKSTYAGNLTLNMSAVVVDEITLLGSRCGPFEPALRLMATGQIDPRPLITARYPLPAGLQAFEHADRPGALKVLLYPPT